MQSQAPLSFLDIALSKICHVRTLDGVVDCSNISHGGTSEVYQVERSKIDGTFATNRPFPVALKLFNLNYCDWIYAGLNPAIVHEVNVLWFLNGKSAFAQIEAAVMVLDDMKPGVLLKLYDGDLSEVNFEGEFKIELLRDLGHELNILHDSNIVHGDIKPQNVLINNDLKAEQHFILSDFGSVFRLDSIAGLLNAKEYVHSLLPYRCPEHISGVVTRPTKESDMWSLGILMLCKIIGEKTFDELVDSSTFSISNSALCTGKANEQNNLFPSSLLVEVEKIIKMENYAAELDENNIDVLRRMYALHELLNTDPVCRLTASGLNTFLKKRLRD